MKDYGWPTVIDVASGKYDAGVIAHPGPPPLVEVTQEDCKLWLEKNA